jgi:Sap, sulfolipid-1-addressing protein
MSQCLPVGDVFSIFLLSLLAMFNPTLLAAVTVMMLLPDPKRLITGFLLGAYLSAMGVGLAIVFSLNGASSGTESSKSTLSPLEDLVFGAILLIVGWVLLSGRAARAKERRKRRHEQKHSHEEPKQSFPERMLGRGSVRLSFVAGALLSLPGASYFVALDKISKLNWPTATTALAVIVFVLIEMLLLEVPLFGFFVAPDWTARAVVRFRAWISANAVRTGGWVAITLGCLLIIRGTAYLIAG